MRLSLGQHSFSTALEKLLSQCDMPAPVETNSVFCTARRSGTLEVGFKWFTTKKEDGPFDGTHPRRDDRASATPLTDILASPAPPKPRTFAKAGAFRSESNLQESPIYLRGFGCGNTTTQAEETQAAFLLHVRRSGSQRLHCADVADEARPLRVSVLRRVHPYPSNPEKG